MPETKTVTRYGGDVTLKFVGNPWHRYRLTSVALDLDDVVIPSVTDINKQLDKSGLSAWYASETSKHWRRFIRAGKNLKFTAAELNAQEVAAKRAAPDIRDAAAIAGTAAHAEVEAWIKSNPGTPAGQFDSQVARWAEQNGVEFAGTERISCSRGHLFAGTIDGIMQQGGKPGVTDVKTGSTVRSWEGNASIYWPIRLQLAAYVGMLWEEGEIDDPHTAHRYVLHIPIRRGGKLEVFDLADPDSPDYSEWNKDWQAFLHLRGAHAAMEGR